MIPVDTRTEPFGILQDATAVWVKKVVTNFDSVHPVRNADLSAGTGAGTRLLIGIIYNRHDGKIAFMVSNSVLMVVVQAEELVILDFDASLARGDVVARRYDSACRRISCIFAIILTQ